VSAEIVLLDTIPFLATLSSSSFLRFSALSGLTELLYIQPVSINQIAEEYSDEELELLPNMHHSCHPTMVIVADQHAV
jgi:hypothetical protein